MKNTVIITDYILRILQRFYVKNGLFVEPNFDGRVQETFKIVERKVQLVKV